MIRCWIRLKHNQILWDLSKVHLNLAPVGAVCQAWNLKFSCMSEKRFLTLCSLHHPLSLNSPRGVSRGPALKGSRGWPGLIPDLMDR